MKFTAVGDFLIQELFDTNYEGFEEIKDYISKGDVRFFNFETTVNEEGSCPSCEFSGGSYLRVSEKSLDIAKNYGFNLISFNNNHAFDFTVDGFLSTQKAVDMAGFVSTGTGLDLESASKPKYLKTESGTVAVVSVNDELSPGMVAGESNDIYKGRPGVNGLRVSKVIKVTKDQMDFLSDLAKTTGVNAEMDADRADGYLPQLKEGCFELPGLKFELSDKSSCERRVNTEDLERIIRSVKEAKENADFVIVSFHTHTIEGNIENAPEYLRDFCHLVIDNGACAVIGHGPHLIRGIEIYKGAPIFHSLGDFLLQLNGMDSAPPDFCKKLGLPVNADIKEALRVRSDNGKRGLMYKRKMFETFIPYFEIENGELKSLEILPIELGFDLPVDHKLRGVPHLAKDLSFIDRLKELSAPFGTKMTVENGIVKVEI